MVYGRAPSTPITNIIENHIIPTLGDIKLNKLTSMQIQRMYNETKEQGCLRADGIKLYEPLSNSTVRQIYMVLTGILKQAVKDRVIHFNPCDNCRIPKKEKKEMKILLSDEIAPYLDAAKRNGVYPLFLLAAADC